MTFVVRRTREPNSWESTGRKAQSLLDTMLQGGPNSPEAESMLLKKEANTTRYTDSEMSQDKQTRGNDPGRLSDAATVFSGGAGGLAAFARQPGTKRTAFDMDNARRLANSKPVGLLADLIERYQLPIAATAYGGERVKESFQDMLRRNGIKLSIDT